MIILINKIYRIIDFMYGEDVFLLYYVMYFYWINRWRDFE